MKNSVLFRKSRGVTIIEMTVVIAILSVIFIMLFLSYEFFVKKVKVTRIALETKEYSKSLESFHLIYGGLPGDLASAQKRISASLIDGDGDGRISTEEEQFQVWPHLSEAKLLEKSGGGKYIGLPTNNTPLLGTHLPYIRNSDNLAVGVVFNTPSGYRANSFIVGGLNGRDVSRPILTQSEIQLGDQKYDDGFATSGSWMCGTNPPAGVCNYSNSAQQSDNFMLYLPFTRTLSSSSSTSCPPQSLQIGTLVANIPEVAPSASYTGNCRDINPNYMGTYQVTCNQQSGGNYALDIISNACTLKKCVNIYNTGNVANSVSVQSGNVLAGNNLVYSCTSPDVPKAVKCMASLTDDTAAFNGTPECVAASSIGTPGNIPIYDTATQFKDSGHKFNDAGSTNYDVFSANRIFELLGKSTINNNYITKFNETETRLLQSLIFDNGTSVSIGTDTPKAKALLEMQSTSQGFLPPRMTTVQRNAITDSLNTTEKEEIAGLTIFNLDVGKLQYWDGTAWSVESTLDTVPIGTIVAWSVENQIPSGWRLLDGSVIDPEQYPELAAIFGANLPNFQGQFLRGYDPLGTIDPDGETRVIAQTVQGQSTSLPTNAFTTSIASDHTHGAGTLVANFIEGDTDGGDSSNRIDTAINSQSIARRLTITGYTAAAGAHTHSITGGGDSETRPTNIAVHYIVKAKQVAMSQASVDSIVTNLLDDTSPQIGNRLVKFNAGGTQFMSSIVSEVSGSLGVNTDTPSANAVLDLFSATDKGLLLPNVDTTTTLTAPLSTDKGLLVYDTTSNQLKFWNGTAWTSAGGTQLWSQDGTQGIKNTTDGDIVMVRGTFGSGQTLTTTGAGTRMFFYPKKAAFRAGAISTGSATNMTEWNDANIGNYSTAMGLGTIASGNYSTAMGFTALASGVGSISAGGSTTASGPYATAIGWKAISTGQVSSAIGYYVTAQSWGSFAVGQYNVIAGNQNSWVATDPLFVAGNGADASNRSNAITLLKNGSMTIAGTLTQNSDARLKEKVEDYDFEDALEKIKQVRTVSYEWKNKKTYGNGTKYGVIAQEIKKLFPEFVEEGKASGGYMSVSYDHLTLPLINATKQLASEQDKIKARLEKLEKAEVKNQGDDTLITEVTFLRNMVYVLIVIVSLMAIAMVGMFIMLRKTR